MLLYDIYRIIIIIYTIII